MLKEWQIVALLGITIIVYARLFLRDRTSTTPNDSMMKQMEETVEQFGYVLEEENKQLMDHLLQLKTKYESETAKLSGKVERLEKQLDALQVSFSLQKSPMSVEVNSQSEPTEEQSLEPSIESKSPTPSIVDRYETIFSYYQSGKSIDWIAKKTGIHQGEVQLILRLAQQEEETRA